MMTAYYFTEDVRHALAGAREEAYRLTHAYVGTEHIALGVLHMAPLVAVSVLGSADQAALIAEIERRAGPALSPAAAAPDLPYTFRAKRVLALAAELGR